MGERMRIVKLYIWHFLLYVYIFYQRDHIELIKLISSYNRLKTYSYVNYIFIPKYESNVKNFLVKPKLEG